MAFITDSTSNGPNGIIVVDLASSRSWRRLQDHPSTKPDGAFVPVVEGEILEIRLPGQPPQRFCVGPMELRSARTAKPSTIAH
jgi:hypothetical protein